MKHIKKCLALALTLAMVMAMGITAFAAENHTITINNAVEGQDYVGYKMLDLSVDSDTEPTAYRYTVNSAWQGFFTNQDDAAWKQVFEIDKHGYVTARNSVTDDSSEIKTFAKAAAEWAAKNKPTSISGSYQNRKVTFTTGDGYYLITSTLGTNAMIETTPDKSAVIINEKNSVPSQDKVIVEAQTEKKANDVNVGDTVNYKTTIKGQPGAKGYVLTDTMSTGLTYNKDAAVANATKGEDKDYTITETDHGFVITFTQSYLDKIISADTEIVVTYSATVNDKAVIAGDGNTNETKLAYSDKTATETTPSTTTTYTWGFDVFKYTAGDENTKTPLAGAKFSLYTDERCETALKFIKESTEGGKDKYLYNAQGSATEFTTPESGLFTLEGLDEGTYYLKETEAPAGYNKLADSDNPITVVIASATTGAGNNTKMTMTLKKGDVQVERIEVLNQTGTELPSTGGIGTTIFYVLGGILVVGAGVVLITRKRMGAQK